MAAPDAIRARRPNPGRWYRRALAIAALAVIVVPIAVPAFTLTRARRRVLTLLQRELGRRVSTDAIHLHLLPWPAVELTNIHLGEAPAFGSEDMITAESATATLRLLSLWSGPLEFSSIHLRNANLNLVRNEAGQWNFAELLSGAAAASPAVRPTAAATALRQPVRFPYLELADGRVNLKLGNQKQRLYLDNVQASLALESGRWRVHARFQPARTDASLSNPGDVNVEGWWQAGRQTFRDLRFDLNVRVENGYLAATSALATGHDAGVHGIVRARLRVRGSGHEFSVTGGFETESLRRWDLLPSSVTLRGAIDASYSPAEDALSLRYLGDNLRRVWVSGRVEHLFTGPRAQLTAELHDLPASSIVSFARAVKGRLPDNLTATGLLNGSALVETTSEQRPWWQRLTGSGTFSASGVQLVSGNDRLSIESAGAQWNGASFDAEASGALLAVGHAAPAELDLGARLTGGGFTLAVGSSAISATQSRALARLCGFDAPWPTSLQGSARLHLLASAQWSAFRLVTWTGATQLGPAVYMLGSAPIGLSQATLVYLPSGEVSAQFGGTIGRSSFTGSAQFIATGNTRQFSLRFSHAAASDLERLLVRRRPNGLSELLHPAPRSVVVLPSITADGTLDFAQLDWHGYGFALHAKLAGRAGTWQASDLQLSGAGGVVKAPTAHCDANSCGAEGRVIGVKLARLLAEGSEFSDRASTPDRASPLARWRGRISGTLFADFRLLLPLAQPAAQLSGKFLLFNGAIAPLPRQAAASSELLNRLLEREDSASATPAASALMPSSGSQVAAIRFVSLAGSYQYASETLSLRNGSIATARRRSPVEASATLESFPQQLYLRVSEALSAPPIGRVETSRDTSPVLPR